MSKELQENQGEIISPECGIQESKPNELSIISDETLVGVYEEILDNLRSDRDQVSGLVDTFSNMVLNDGDASTSSKEALVNLVKTKIDATDRMAKIADLMTRIKLRQPDTFQPWMNKGKDKSGNTINIYDSSGLNRKSLMERIQKGKLDDEPQS
jgi:hypothetical protein